MSKIWIVAVGAAGIENLVTTARQLGGELTAAVVGDRSIADAVAQSGVDKVVWFGDPGQAPLEAFAGPVADAVAAAKADVVLVPARHSDRAVAGAVAARLAAPIFTMVTAVACHGGVTTLTHATLGGIAQETVAVTGAVVIVAEGGAVASGGSASVETVAATPADTLTIMETRPATHEAVDLSKAKRIVSVGRGLKSEEDLALVEALAAALGAEVSCSRPLAEGVEWFSHDRYIGVTGRHVAPDLYVAIGISGQVQHVVGARGAGTVVVVNSDKDAPYFAECDYGLVGDLYAIIPAITEALK